MEKSCLNVVLGLEGNLGQDDNVWNMKEFNVARRYNVTGHKFREECLTTTSCTRCYIRHSSRS
jgi:hypothetical protein